MKPESSNQNISPQPKRNYWKDKKVLVTGGAGFIGSHLVEQLMDRGAELRVADSLVNGSVEKLRKTLESVDLAKVDLADFESCLKVCSGMDIVLNLAAKVAGVAYNSTNSAVMFDSNVRIGTNMLEAARRCDINRFLVVSSACVYSRDSTVPTPENEGFLEDPEPSNLGYGWAKRILEVQGRLYAQQYGIKIGIARPFNTYGPRDHFDTESGHVIPSLIRKVVSGEDPLTVWGNGQQTRSFVYVSDTVSAMLSLIERFPYADPVNIGSDEETSIGNLAKLIVHLAGSKQRFAFDATKPQGQPRRQPDLKKAKSVIDLKPATPLSVGLAKTIEWYKESTIMGNPANAEPNADS